MKVTQELKIFIMLPLSVLRFSYINQYQNPYIFYKTPPFLILIYLYININFVFFQYYFHFFVEKVLTNYKLYGIIILQQTL